MQFLKKHYEKMILSVVLLGLVVAAALLPYEVSRVRQFLDDTVSGVVRTQPKVFEPLDLSTNQTTIKRFGGNADFDFTELHNVFNPVRWQKRPDGALIPMRTGKEMGPGAVVVKSIRELNLTVSFEGVSGTSDNPRYHFVVIKESDTNPRRTQSATQGVPNVSFTLEQVRGPAENPNELVLVLKDEKEAIVVTKDKPYQRVVGYEAELLYPPDPQYKFRSAVRVKDTVKLPRDPETYKIVAITKDEVVLSAESTQKRTTIEWHGTTTDTSAL